MQTCVAPTVTRFARADWDLLFGGSAFGWDYCRAAEEAPPPGFELSAMGVLADGVLVAAAPVFRTTYRLDMSFPPSVRRIGDWAGRLCPRLLSLPIVGLGSPTVDRCLVGFLPTLDRVARGQAWQALVEGLEQFARDTRSDFLAVKDVAEADRGWAEPVLHARRFTPMASLPVAVLDLPFATEADYIDSLSASMRQDLKRKVRQSRDRVKFQVRSSVHNLETELADLYAATRSQRRADYGDFDALSPTYIAKVLEHVGERAQLVVAWVADELASFSLFLQGRDCVFAHRIGMRYPLARTHNLYFLNWLKMVEICRERGIRRLEMGQTSYPQKLRLGCRLEASSVYIRHRLQPVNWLVASIAPSVGFDKMEEGARAD